MSKIFSKITLWVKLFFIGGAAGGGYAQVIPMEEVNYVYTWYTY